MTSIMGGIPAAGAAVSLFDRVSPQRTFDEAYDRRIESARNDPEPLSRRSQGLAAAEANGDVMRKAMQAESVFLTQQIAQEGGDTAPEAGADEVAVQRPDPVQVFLDYMAKTPEERFFDSFLKSKGLTEESFEALPAEERQALMREFEELVKTRAEEQAAEKLAQV